MRTFSQDVWTRALQAWDDGEFSDEWRDVRHQAAMRGIIFPPSGTQWDSWADDEPSQRAVLIRAIRETPEALREALSRASSWSGVIGQLIAANEERYDGLDFEERRERRRRAELEPSPRIALTSIRDIVARIRDS